MDESSTEISGSASPNDVVASEDIQPSPPRAVFMSVFDRVKNFPNSPTNLLQTTNSKPDPAKNLVVEPMKKASVGSHMDLMPECSSSNVCEFCLSPEEMRRLQTGNADAKLVGDKASLLLEQAKAGIFNINDDSKMGQKKNEITKEPSFPIKVGADPKSDDLPTLRLRDIQKNMPEKSTAAEALGKYFNVTIVNPKIDTKTFCSKIEQEEADEIPRTKSEEFTPMAQEEEEVKKLLEEVRMVIQPGEHGEGKETVVAEESAVGGEAKISEMKPLSIVSLKKSSSSDLSLESITSSVHSFDYGPDMDDSGLEDDLAEMVHRKFVLLRRIPNTFPFSKDCLNVMDVTNQDEYEGKGGDDPHPVVTLTVRGIVPLNPDGTPLPYQDTEPEMSTEVDMNCHCCHLEVLPTMSDEDLDDDDDEGDELDGNSSVEDIRRNYGMKDPSLSSLDMMAQTVSGND